MLIRTSAVILLLLALHVGAQVFKTNEIPDVPAQDLVPPPEDQESILIRYQGQKPPSKSFLQRIVTWFGFNGDNKSQNQKSKQQQFQRQPAHKQNGNYVYENPAKPPLTLQPQKFQQSAGFNYDDPNKMIQSQQQTGYTYEPPKPLKIQQLPQNGQLQNRYNYDAPSVKLQQLPQITQPQSGYAYDPPPVKLQQIPQTAQQQSGYNYDPPPVKLQQLPQSAQHHSGYNYDPPPVKLQQIPQISKPDKGYLPALKLQEQQPTRVQNGYNYDKPLKLQQRPASSLNDLVSSAASPTAIYTNAVAIPQFNQGQSSDTFPCNKVPWLPIFPSAEELNLLRARLQAKNPSQFQASSGYNNIQPIARPSLDGFSQQLNAHTYLQRPLRQPSFSTLNHINALPVQNIAQPFRLTAQPAATGYQPLQNVVLPVETTQHSLIPIPLPNLSITPIPPLFDPKPFALNNAAQSNDLYINGRIVTPTGHSTNSVQSLQIINQNHPVSQPVINYGVSENQREPATEYGQPHKINEPATVYGLPSKIVYPSTSYGVPFTTYGPPTNTYGTPPVRLTSVVTESSALSRFTASQPFTPRPTRPFDDQAHLSSSNIEQNSNSLVRPILISDNAVDASESTRSPQETNTISEMDDENAPIRQVLNELNVTNAPITERPSYSQRIETNQNNNRNFNRETPLNLLDTPNFRKINDSQVPAFNRNTWKPLPPNPFSTSVGSVITTEVPRIHTSPVTPSAASSAFQMNNLHDSSSNVGQPETTTNRNKKIQIIIPYTSKSHPSPFKNNEQLQSFESSDGWSQSNSHDDFHNSEESQVISAATPTPSPSPSPSPSPEPIESVYLTRLLTKNLRELLRREHLNNLSAINLEKLQKNIDGWTEEEFSMSPNRASTISLYTQPKQIPYEFLTTTQAFDDSFTTEIIPTTNIYPITSFNFGDNISDNSDDQSEDESDGEAIEEQTEDQNLNEIRGADETDIDEEAAIQQAAQIDDFKRLDYSKSLENHASGTEQRIFYATNPPERIRTTTPLPPCSTTTQAYHTSVRTTVLPSTEELWNKLKSLLSPGGGDKREKVYVVTPQPYPSHNMANEEDNEVVANFKSPRFLVRPTPGVSAGGRSLNTVARLSFMPRASRLQTTTVRTTWKEPETATEVFRSLSHRHSVINGHAHAQAFSIVTPKMVKTNDENVEYEDVENSESIAPAAQRSSLEMYKHSIGR